MNYVYPCKPNWLAPNSSFFGMLDNDERWVAELKKNGWRCEVYKYDGKITLYTRDKALITDKLPRLREYLRSIVPENTILDGELIHNRTKNIKELFYAFDVLKYKGISLINQPFSERRKCLESMKLGLDGVVEVAEQYTKNKIAVYQEAIKTPVNEGIVMKRLDSKYLSSFSSCLQNPHWMKVKRIEEYYIQNRRIR